MTTPADTRTCDSLTRDRLRERLSRYGFVECSMLICFLDMCCCERPGQGELLYIRSKIRACLWSHDEGSAWFDDLRLMESQVSRALALQAALAREDTAASEPDFLLDSVASTH